MIIRYFIICLIPLILASCGDDFHWGWEDDHKSSTTTSVANTTTSNSGASAKCNDGTYSYSSNCSGTCSSHGGVSIWMGALSGCGSKKEVLLPISSNYIYKEQETYPIEKVVIIKSLFD